MTPTGLAIRFAHKQTAGENHFAGASANWVHPVKIGVARAG